MKFIINDKTGFVVSLLLLISVYTPIASAEPGLIPEGYSEQPFGEPAALPGGGTLTVSRYDPDIALSRTNQFGDEVYTISSLISVKMCAGSAELTKMASEVYFSLARVISTGRESISGTPSTGIRDPSLQPDFVPHTLMPGECAEGWVAFTRTGHPGDKVLENASSIWFDPAVLGQVPADQQVKLAWRLPVE